MGNLEPNDIAYYGKPIATLSREELLKALLELANIINNCPVKGECGKLLAGKDITSDKRE